MDYMADALLCASLRACPRVSAGARALACASARRRGRACRQVGRLGELGGQAGGVWAGRGTRARTCVRACKR